MSHIVRFSITGLAGRAEPYSQELDRHVNVFFGLNGTGKTSLLKILSSAMSQDTSLLARVPFDSAQVTIWSIHYNTELTTTISRPSDTKLVEKGGGEELAAPPKAVKSKQFGWRYTKPPPQGVGGWLHVYLPTWRLSPYDPSGSEYQLSAPFRAQPEDWDIFFARNLNTIWTRYSNELLSELQRIQGEGLVRILRGIMRPSRAKTKIVKFDTDLAFSRVSAFLNRQGARGVLDTKESFEKRYRQNRQLRKVVDDINLIEEQVETARASRNSLEKLIVDMFIGNKKIIFRDNAISVEAKSGKEIGLESLSSGEKQILELFIQSLLARRHTLLIDEPEISLHVDWQRRLISSMQLLNRDAQYILATHSPEIMADVSDEHIFRL